MVPKSEVINEILNINLCESDEEFVKSKFYKCGNNITRERYDIVNKRQVKYYGKPLGRYELISIPDPLLLIEEDLNLIRLELVKIVKSMLGRISSKNKILVVGLGNRHISADSLGTAICKNVNINMENSSFPHVMSICPSVMGLTGIETYEIVRGVISRVKPTHLILIDSLCAGDESRLCRSIQLTNTGICPGSGIGNKRKCIDRSLAPNVISIGVPLLIYSDTFINSKFDRFNINISKINGIMRNLKKLSNMGEIQDLFNNLLELMQSKQTNTIVTIKDIEECVEILSKIIADSINIALNVAELK